LPNNNHCKLVFKNWIIKLIAMTCYYYNEAMTNIE
jgi:hypothetical protein